MDIKITRYFPHARMTTTNFFPLLFASFAKIRTLCFKFEELLKFLKKKSKLTENYHSESIKNQRVELYFLAEKNSSSVVLRAESALLKDLWVMSSGEVVPNQFGIRIDQRWVSLRHQLEETKPPILSLRLSQNLFPNNRGNLNTFSLLEASLPIYQ